MPAPSEIGVADGGADARASARSRFLANAGWRNAEVITLAGDASARRYHRVSRGEDRAMLMDVPPEAHIDCLRFVAMDRWLAGQGCSVPNIAAMDIAQGLVLLEDFGDDLFARLLAAESDLEPMLYEAAVDVLITLQAKAPPDQIDVDGVRYRIPPYGREKLREEVGLFLEWYLPAVGDATLPETAREAFFARWDAVLDTLAPMPSTIVLRDYHAENLIWLPDRDGPARVGLLDFQDAMIGVPAYDLVSLLEDARRDVSADLAEAMVTRYLSGRQNVDPVAFRTSYAVFGAQRNTKIVGIFARLFGRDGKPQYLKHLPRVWRYLEDDLRHPALTPVRDWFDEWVPDELRRAAVRPGDMDR